METHPTEEPKPWDKLPDESAASFQAFRFYLEAGLGRTLNGAWEQYKAARGLTSETRSYLFSEWRKEHDWDARCAAFDGEVLDGADDVIRKQRIALVQSINEAAPRVLKVALKLALGDETTPPDGTMARFILSNVLPNRPTISTNIVTSNVEVTQEMVDKLSTDEIVGLIRDATNA